MKSFWAADIFRYENTPIFSLDWHIKVKKVIRRGDREKAEYCIFGGR